MLDDGYHDLKLLVPYYTLKEEETEFDILRWEIDHPRCNLVWTR